MLHKTLRVVATATVALAFSAAIAGPLGALPAWNPDDYDRALAANAPAIRSMADCIVKGRPAEARKAVGEAYSLVRMRKETPGLVRAGCMGATPGMGRMWNAVVFGGDRYLYALAEAVIRQDRVLDKIVDLSNVSPLIHREPFVDETVYRHRFSKADADKLIERDRQREAMQVFLSRYGECVVRNAPEASRTLLRSDVGKPDERAAFAALQPVLGSCMKGADQVRFGKPALRGAIALNYYRLTATAPVSGAKGSKL